MRRPFVIGSEHQIAFALERNVDPATESDRAAPTDLGSERLDDVDVAGDGVIPAEPHHQCDAGAVAATRLGQ